MMIKTLRYSRQYKKRKEKSVLQLTILKTIQLKYTLITTKIEQILIIH
jgi:hypothetical protein